MSVTLPSGDPMWAVAFSVAPTNAERTFAPGEGSSLSVVQMPSGTGPTTGAMLTWAVTSDPSGATTVNVCVEVTSTAFIGPRSSRWVVTESSVCPATTLQAARVSDRIANSGVTRQGSVRVPSPGL